MTDPTRRMTVPYGDEEIQLDRAEVAEWLAGADERRAEPVRPDSREELQAKLSGRPAVVPVTGPAPRLRIELVPRPLWKRNLRGGPLTHTEWRRLRRWALDEAGNACQACGHYVEGGRNLVCHELWSYDDATLIQTLTGVEIHCRDCDAVTHIGRIGAVAGMVGVGRALRQLARVNGWSPRQAMAHYGEARAEYERRSGLVWTQDIGWYERWAARVE